MSNETMAERDEGHLINLAADLQSILQSGQYSDVTIIVDGTRMPLHKPILAARSDYFRALLYGGLKESTAAEVTLHDTDLTSFKILLSYVYSGLSNTSLSKMKVEALVGILGLAHQYGFIEFERNICRQLNLILNEKNVLFIYQAAFAFCSTELMNSALKFIDRHAASVLKSAELQCVSANALREILSRDSLCTTELVIFDAVRVWASKNKAADGIRTLLSAVRFVLLTSEELLLNVRRAALLDDAQLLDVLELKLVQHVELPFRGYLEAGVNVVTPTFNTRVVSGDANEWVMDSETPFYDQERGFLCHQIEPNKCITLKLGHSCIVNNIKLLLWDKDRRVYSYYVETSVDGEHWTRVVDYSAYHCRSWQDLYFPRRVCQFIKIVGTHNSTNRLFHLVKIEARYKEEAAQLSNGIVVPHENVASVSRYALVIEGVTRVPNSLIDGSLSYNWDTGYCCHQIGTGSEGIVVELAQPYVLSTLRVLLWDCDERQYTYHIEVSSNRRDWHIVADTRSTPCSSWQSHTFAPRPVVYIRLLGHSNTANEVFHVVHLETPNQSKDRSEAGTVNAEPIMDVAEAAAGDEGAEPMEAEVAEVAAPERVDDGRPYDLLDDHDYVRRAPQPPPQPAPARVVQVVDVDAPVLPNNVENDNGRRRAPHRFGNNRRY